MKQDIVYWKTLKAGILTESDEGYSLGLSLYARSLRHKPNNAIARRAICEKTHCSISYFNLNE